MHKVQSPLDGWFTNHWWWSSHGHPMTFPWYKSHDISHGHHVIPRHLTKKSPSEIRRKFWRWPSSPNLWSSSRKPRPKAWTWTPFGCASRMWVASWTVGPSPRGNVPCVDENGAKNGGILGDVSVKLQGKNAGKMRAFWVVETAGCGKIERNMVEREWHIHRDVVKQYHGFSVFWCDFDGDTMGIYIQHYSTI